MLFRRNAVVILATVGCIGRIPMAPGTWGALLGLPIAYGFSRMGLAGAVAFSLALTGAAIWICQAAERQLDAKDPGCIVIDEIAGMAVTLLGIPLTFGTGAAGFLLFRFFDILKPPPVRVLERRLSGGWGIVMDDIAAGALANIVLRIGLYLSP